MDVESELNLYSHVEFLSAVPSPNEKSTELKHKSVQNNAANNLKRKRKVKKKKNKQQPEVDFALVS